jgi:hypothetical protein
MLGKDSYLTMPIILVFILPIDPKQLVVIAFSETLPHLPEASHLVDEDSANHQVLVGY